MKAKLIIAGIIAMVFFFSSSSNASPVNIAQGATVSLSGDSQTFFYEWQDWSTSHPDGSAYSDTLRDSIVDGIFLTEGTQWDQSTLWWDEHNPAGARTDLPAIVTIDLGGTYSISSFILQADNNDGYQISYFNLATSALESVIFGPYGSWGMFTRPTMDLSSPIIANQLSIQAVSGDGWYSLSEIQALGNPIPEPTSLLLLGTGLGVLGLAAYRRRRK